MRRLVFTTFVLTLLSVWASGQSAPGGPLAGEQLKLFEGNRGLLEELVDRTVELANADTPVAKVRACHESTKALGRALRDAADRDDADRVTELSDHLTAVINHGLVPTIDDARKTVPVGTQAEKELFELTSVATQDAERFELAIPALGKVGGSSKVQDARAKLRGANEGLKDRNRSRE